MRNLASTPFITIILVFLTCTFVHSQQKTLGCDGNRYVEEIFTSTTLITTVFGETELMDGTPVNLEMDIFQPEGDTSSRRPVIILAHSVIDGRSEMYSICEKFAKQGFISASIDYRKQEVEPTYDEWLRDGIRKTQDMKAAVRYFRKDFRTDNLFRADTNFIFVGGFSIGGVMGLNVAYIDEDDPEDSRIDSLIATEGGLIGYPNDTKDISSNVQGVINLSGSILFTKWIDEGEPAVASYHGTADNVVSIGYGSFDNVFFTYGSQDVHAEATLKGIPNYFHPVEGGGHFDIYGPQYTDEFEAFIQGTSAFYKDSVLCTSKLSTNTPIQITEKKVTIFPNPSSDHINIHCVGNTNYQLIIYNSLGQIVRNITLIANDQRLQISDLPPGLHFYHIRNENENIQSGKLVFQ